MRIVTVVLLLLIATLAGCIGNDDNLEPESNGNDNGDTEDDLERAFKNATSTQLEKEFGAIEIVAKDDPDWKHPNVTKDDWLFLSTSLSEAGEVTGFTWEFPQEAITQHPETGQDILVLNFALALTPMGSPAGLPEGTDWLFMAVIERFNDDSGQWEARTMDSLTRMGVTKEVSRQAAGGSPASTTEPAGSDPFTFTIPYESGVYGEQVHFVLAARGPSNAEFAIGARMLGEHPGDRIPAVDWEDFHRQVGDDVAPYVPIRALTAQGLYLAEYEERHVIGQDSRINSTADIGEPEESLPTELYPYITTREFQLGTGVDWGGWSRLHVSYTSTAELGTLELMGSVHGESLDRTFYFLGHAGVIPDDVQPDDFFPFPFHRMVVEGGDSVSVDITLTKSGAIGGENFRLNHYSIGLQIGELTGLPLHQQIPSS